MGLDYHNLDDVTRGRMTDEIEYGGHYDSPRLTQDGKAQWQDLLRTAADQHDDDWLAAELLRRQLFNDSENYTRNGITRSRTVNAPQSAAMLAEGEFNRFYLQGLCRRAMDEGKTHLTIYRAKAVREERPESAAKIGTQVAVEPLLNALRNSDFVAFNEAFGVSNGPNSGLSAHL